MRKHARREGGRWRWFALAGWGLLAAGCTDRMRGDTGIDCPPVDEQYVLSEVPESEWPACDDFGPTEILDDIAAASGTWSVTLACDDSSYSGTATLAFGGCSDPSEYLATTRSIEAPDCDYPGPGTYLECESGWVTLSGWAHGSYDGPAHLLATFDSSDCEYNGNYSGWGLLANNDAYGDADLVIAGTDSLAGVPLDQTSYVAVDGGGEWWVDCEITFDERVDEGARRRRGATLPPEPPTCPEPAAVSR